MYVLHWDLRRAWQCHSQKCTVMEPGHIWVHSIINKYGHQSSLPLSLVYSSRTWAPFHRHKFYLAKMRQVKHLLALQASGGRPDLARGSGPFERTDSASDLPLDGAAGMHTPCLVHAMLSSKHIDSVLAVPARVHISTSVHIQIFVTAPCHW